MKHIKDFLYFLNEGIENKLFNTDALSQKEVIEALKAEISPIVPYCNIHSGAFGNEHILVTVSFDPKDKWPNRIFENSNYFRMMIEENGTIEVFTTSLYKKDAPIKYENRLGIKFRKTKAKSLDDLKTKIVKFIETIKEQYK